MVPPSQRIFRAAVLLLAVTFGCSPESLLGGGSGALAVSVSLTTASRSACVQVTVTPTTGAPQSTSRLEYTGTPLKVAVYRGTELTDEVQVTASGFASCTGTEPALERSDTTTVRFPWSGSREVALSLGPVPAKGDADGDGFVASSAGGDDCDDTNRDIHPGAVEDCEGSIDTNCDTKIHCDEASACVTGQCVERDCPRMACAPWQYCRDGVRCEDAACAGLECEAGKTCVKGECAASGCDGGTCGDGGVCDRGTCVDRACYQANCATGERCVRGTCTSCPTGTFPGGDGGTCVADFRAGAACDSPLDCATGTCSDGVCCNVACTGTCQACNLDGGAGTCATVPAGKDPLSWCGEYQCSGSTPACLTGCTRDADCKPTSYCDGALCQPRLPAGAACTVANRCLSNACADGVCCDTACTGTCEACDLDGGVGTCSPVLAGVDPEGECPGLLTCNGTRGCFRPVGDPCASAADCQSGFCADGVCCNGACNGTCEACNLQGRAGLCTAVASHEDPSDECPGILTCSGTGNCYRGNGVACIISTDCESGTCVDGVCCDRACGGSCEACNVAGNVGTCNFVPVNTDPAGECPGVLTCNGGGACYKGPGASCVNGTECQAGRCLDGVCCATDCSGTCEACNVPGSAGTCTEIPLREDPASECGAYFCAGARGSCSTACTEEADCKPGNACVAGGCIPKQPSGTACVGNDRCLSGFCVDGYCCNSACAGTCQACNVPNALGTCTLSPSGTDYGGDCGSYFCNGTGACFSSCPTGNECKAAAYCTTGAPASRTCQPKFPLGTACTSAGTCLSGNCVDGVCCDTGCSGSCRACNVTGKEGTCTPQALLTDPESECGTTWCNGASACLPTCAGDTDCKSGSYCNAGACLVKKVDGQACSAANQCGSGFCTDGVCCNAACGGTCQACNLAGAVGSCTSIPLNTDPANECGQLQCSGSAACYATCGSDAHCKAGLFCNAGTCTAKKPAATACTAANQCASGFCADGVCCDSTCTGTCRACNVANTVGTCVNVPAFSDPANECAGATTCSGSATCFKDRGTACTVNGECQTNACADGVCCDSDCTGTCRSCKLSGNTGTCTSVPIRTDPDAECTLSFCNGAAACMGSCADDLDCEVGAFCNGGTCALAGVPGAPTGVSTLNGTSASLVVGWTAPSNTGGGTTPLTGYVASTTTGNFSCTAIPPATTCTLTGLTNGTSYQVQVFAQNGLGTGPGSTATPAMVVGTVPGAPGTPTLTNGTAGALDVSWTAATAAPGNATTKYTATLVGGTGSCTATPPATSCSISGLGDGSTWQVQVTATNAVGNGPASAASSPKLVGTGPDAPTSVTATNGTAGTLTVSWTAPVNQGGGTNAITSYTATANPGGATCTANSGSPVATTCALTGLNNGTAYTVTVTATNGVGTSGASSASASRTVGTVPDAPTAVTTTNGSAGTLAVTWTAPTNKGGGTNAITSYTATASPGGEKCTSSSGNPVTPGCTLSNLSDGVAYTVTVTASNAVGTGAASAASTSKTSGTVPGVPGAPVVVNGTANALDVSWTASTAGTGGPTSYVATATPVAPATGGGSCSPQGALTSCTITGLDNNSSYTVTVVASNAAGSSAASGPSAPKTVGTVPGAPGIPSVTNGTAGQLGVSWTSSSAGSGGTTSYVATAVAVSPGTGSGSCSVSGTSCTITGLTDGTAYTVTVVASNSSGSSVASGASSAATVGTAPGAPTGVVAVNGTTGQLSVSWTAPANKGGGTNTVTSYAVSTTPAGGTCSTSATSCTLTGLTDGTSYTVSVTASNTIGTSATAGVSGAKVVGTVPSAPGTPTVTNGASGTLAVSWAASTSNAANAPLSYVATATAVAPGTGSASCSSSSTSCNITGLTDGTQYTVTVVATNNSGSSTASPASAAMLVGTVPDAPTGVTLAGGTTGSLSVAWVAPANKGGGTNAVLSYTATASPGGATCSSSSGTPVNPGCTLSGLADTVTYTVTVTATNGIGTSAASNASSGKVVGSPPSAPTGLTVGNSTAGTLNVSWTGSSNAGTAGGTVQYTATATAVAPGTGGNSCGPTSGTSCNITGLADGTAYTVTVVASNDAGSSAAAGPSSSKTVGTVPDAPTGVTLTNGTSNQLAVSWSAPANKGGGTNAITRYTATATNAATSATAGSCTITTGTPVTPGCTITSGVADGSRYTVTVVAGNAVGDSASSAASAEKYVGTLPAAPTGLTVGNGTAATLNISWSAGSAGTGGGTVQYIATATAVSPGTGGNTCGPTSSTSCNITGLTDGTAYTVTVVATNNAGSGATAGPSAAKTVGVVPDAPTAVTLTNGTSNQLGVAWTAPSNVGGGTNAVTSYTATASPGGGTCTSNTGSPITPGCTITSGVSNGSAYTVTVVANNAVGPSATSAISGSKYVGTVPGTPAISGVTNGTAGTLTPNWSAVSAGSGGGTVQYVATALAVPPAVGSSTCSTTGTSCNVTGLTDGLAYTLTVVASNNAGSSPASASSASKTVGTVPGAPSSVTATNGVSGKLTAYWSPPANQGGGVNVVTSYSVTTTPAGGTCTTSNTTCELTGLSNGTAYTVNVTASNAVSPPASSAGTSASKTVGTLPAQPTGLVAARAGQTSTTLSWTAGSSGTSAFTGYVVETSTDGTNFTVYVSNTGSTSASYTVTGLSNGGTYWFRVSGISAVGTGPASANSTCTPSGANGCNANGSVTN